MPADEIERKRNHDTSQRLFRCSIHDDNQNNRNFKSRLFRWQMECLVYIDILAVDLNSVTLKFPNAKFEVISSKDMGSILKF